MIIPGSGKGTQCEKMIEQYGFTHLSAGDLIRAAAQDPSTEKGRYFNEAMSQGKLVSTVIEKATFTFQTNIFFVYLFISRTIFLIYSKMQFMKKPMKLPVS